MTILQLFTTLLVAIALGGSPLLVMQATASELETFVDNGNLEFQRLCKLLPEARCKSWQQEQYNRTLTLSSWSQKWQSDGAWIEKENEKDKEALKAVRAFDFLAKQGEFQLRNITFLVEGAGSEALSYRIQQHVYPLENSLETRIANLRTKTSSNELVPTVSALFTIKSEVDTLIKSPPVKRKLIYSPNTSAYDQNPAIVGEYIIHDWISAIETAQKLEERLNKLEPHIHAQEFLSIRDPRAPISLAVQAALLLVTVAGYLISYTTKASVPVVVSLVLFGMGSSIIMVFISDATLLNIVTQSIVPGLFILYWAWCKARQVKS